MTDDYLILKMEVSVGLDVDRGEDSREDMGSNDNNEKWSPEELGILLGSSILKVFEGVPNCSMRPTDLARAMVVSRVIVSRMISSARKENHIETLTSIPGPESVRSILHAAAKVGAPQGDVQLAVLAIDSFEKAIRDQYGTRAAFNAALSVEHTTARNKFEQSSRYQMFKGMSQIEVSKRRFG